MPLDAANYQLPNTSSYLNQPVQQPSVGMTSYSPQLPSYTQMPTYTAQPTQPAAPAYNPSLGYNESSASRASTPPPTTVQPTSNTSSLDSGETDMLSSIIGMGFDAGSMYNQAYIDKHTAEMYKQYRKEDLARWEEVYADEQRQLGRDNIYRDKMYSLSQQQFNWGKQKWKKEFALTTEQWEYNKQLTETQMKQTNLDRSVNEMISIANRNNEFKQNILQLKAY